MSSMPTVCVFGSMSRGGHLSCSVHWPHDYVLMFVSSLTQNVQQQAEAWTPTEGAADTQLVKTEARTMG